MAKKVKEYDVVYRKRRDKDAPLQNVVIDGFNISNVRSKFWDNIQEYDMYANPKYTIVSIIVKKIDRICKDELRCSMSGWYCNECRRNPNAKLKDYFHDRGYIPSCKYGNDDCILDPEYLKYCGSDNSYNCDNCIDGNLYDDEDK